jgi:hypothetical protein
MNTRSIFVLAGLVIVAFFGYRMYSGNTVVPTDANSARVEGALAKDEPTAQPVVPNQNPSTEPPVAAPAARTVSVKTSYTDPSPEGTEQVGFTLELDASGVITGAITEVLAIDPIGKMRQESFAKNLPAAIVGKKLSEIDKIDRVGGSSLTTGAFNKSLADLKAQM